MTFAQANEIQADPYLPLFEFWEEGTDTRERAVMNNESITHNGNVYHASRIQFTPPKADENTGSSSLTMSNVDRVVGNLINRANRIIRVRLMVVDSDNLEEAPMFDSNNLFMLTDMKVSVAAVNATITLRPDVLFPAPGIKTSKDFTAGLYLK